jgi:hypothetical protein
MEAIEMHFSLNVSQLWRRTNQINRVPRRNNEQNARSITMSGVDQSNETARQLNVNARAIIYSFTFSALPLDLRKLPCLLLSSSNAIESHAVQESVGRNLMYVRTEPRLEIQDVSFVGIRIYLECLKNCDLNSFLV